MKHLRYIILVSLITNNPLGDLHLQHAQIKGYFITKCVSFATIFTCQGTESNYRLAREFVNQKVRVNFFDLKNQSSFGCEKILAREHHHLGVVLDGECENSRMMLLNCGKMKLLDETHHWLIVFERVPNLDDYFQNVTLNINADVNIVNSEENGSNWIITDVYNPASEHGGGLKVKQIGIFSLKNGFKNNGVKGSKYWIRRNMTGVTFKSAVVIPKESHGISLQEYLTSDKHREKNSMHRFQSVTVQHCRDLYNFSLKMTQTDSWGYIQNGTKFNGLVGLLQDKVVDFGSTPLIFKYDRMPVVDYSYGNWILKSTFIFRPPASTATSFEIFFRPLGRKVWWSLAVSSVLVALLAKIVLKFESTIFEKFKHSIDATWSFVLIFIVGAFCQQGSMYNPTLTSGRILALFLFILTLLIYQFYSGYIVSYLLMDPPREVNTLEDLLHSSLDAGIENILIDRDYFVQTMDPVALELFRKKIQKPNLDGFYEPDVGLDLVLKKSFAFHVETSTAYPIIKKIFPPRTVCELEEVQMYRTQPMYANLQKHSPFREMLNYCMLRLVENGNMYRLRKYWDSRRPECLPGDLPISISVGLNEFSCALLILAVGVGVSLGFLVAEIVFFSCPMKRFKIFLHKK